MTVASRIADAELRAVLVDEMDLVDGGEFARAQALAARLRQPLEEVVVQYGYVPSSLLLEHLARSWQVGYTDLPASKVAPEALRAVPAEYARAHLLAPFRRANGALHVAMWNPRDQRAVAELAQLARTQIVPYLAPRTAILRAHLLYDDEVRGLLGQAAEADAVRAFDGQSAVALLDTLIGYAALVGASDIHIEPYETEVIVRCRVDGALRDVLRLAPDAQQPLSARIKVLSGMRIDERRQPQDGRFDAEASGLRLDLRASTLPTPFGEKVVLRVLPKERTALDLDHLGLVPDDYARVLAATRRPHGMVLVTGPTGSGKTSTLYAMLARIGADRQSLVNICTVEDPIEYTLPRVTQVQTGAGAGLDFAGALRALLRQDPDVVMLGEIRDLETATMAVRTALVGRLLLSTVHTNDATSAPVRLLDIGIEPFLLASTLELVIGQRLVRRMCHECRASDPGDQAALAALASRPDFAATVAALQRQGTLAAGEAPFAGVRLYRGTGCARCGGTGFSGRIGLFEVLEVDEEVRRAIVNRASAAALRASALARGMKIMFHDGLAKALLGETTIEEVCRVAL